MTIYSGFDPGTFQGWALNLFNNVFVKAGIARGFQMGPTSPASMAIQNTLDSVWSDAVIFLPNGAFVRLDAVTQFSISGNSSGSTRTDALVAQVDPTNQANFFLSVQANWGTGFTPANNNQFVICLISVPNNATSISAGNITMNSAQAQVTGVGGATSLAASDGVTMGVTDNSTNATFTLALSNLPSGNGRAIQLQATDHSSIGHIFSFGPDGTFSPEKGVRANNWYLNPTPVNGETANSIYTTPMSGGAVTKADIHHVNPTGGWYYFDMSNGTGHIDSGGYYSTALAAFNASNSYTVNGHVITVSNTLSTPLNKYDVTILTNF